MSNPSKTFSLANLNIWAAYDSNLTKVIETVTKIKILGETKSLKQWDVTGELRKRLKLALDEARIETPFPQRVVHQARN